MGLLMLLYLLFSSFSFQNYLINRVTGYVNETYKTRISIGEISYDGWTFFSLRKVCFGDQKQDTTFYAGRLQFNIAGMNIDSSHFILNDVVLDEGLCKITTYKDNTYSLDVVGLFSDPNDTISDPNAPPFILELNNLECMDTRVMYTDSTETFLTKGFDPNRIHFFDANFRSRHFMAYDDSLVFDVRNFSIKEQCGFEILRLKANATVCGSDIILDKMDLVTPNSHLKNYFSLHAGSWKNYSDFYNKVAMKAVLNQSEFDMKDAVYFMPDFEIYKFKAKVSGTGKGPLSNLNLKNMVVSIGNDTRFTGDAKFKGLPNIDETFMDVRADYFSTVRPELEQIIGMQLPSAMDDIGKIIYKGNFTGFYEDFVTYGTFETDFGSAETDLNMKVNETTMLSEYSGFLKMNSFQLGAFLNNPDLGILDFESSVSGKGFDLKTLDTRFESNIASIAYNGYTYHNLSVKGEIAREKLQVKALVADTNIELNANILIDLKPVYAHIDMNGRVENVNLKPLNLHSERISLRTDFEADYYFKDLNDHHGLMMIENFEYDKGAYTYRINQLKLEAENDEQEVLRLSGDFIKGELKGEFDLANVYAELEYWSLSLADTFFRPKPVRNAHQNFEFELNVLTTSSISPLLFPGINATNIELQGMMNSDNESFELAGYVGNVNTQGWFLNQTTFKFTEEGSNSGTVLFGFKNLSQTDTVLIGDFALKADMQRDRWNLQYQITDTQSIVTGMFNHDVVFEPNDFWFDYHKSWVKSGNSSWDITDSKSVMFDSKRVLFDHLILQNDSMKIDVDGFYQFSGKEKNISARFEGFELNSINQFVKDLGVELGGSSNGYLVYKNMGNRDVVIGNLNTTDLCLDKDTLGDFTVNIGYREHEEDLLIDFSSAKGKINALKGSGVYDIAAKNLDLAINFGNSKIDAFQAFVKDYVKLYEGTASLNARLSGPLDKLRMDGQLNLVDTRFRVEYLQTVYTIDQAKVTFTDNVIKIIPFDISDINKQKARVEGMVTHKGFSDLDYNIKIRDFKSFQVMNTLAKDNDLFYGTAYASGDFTIKGGSNDVAMYINATSEKGTKIMINPFGASSETGESFIRYTSRDTVFAYQAKGKGSDFGIGVYMNLVANPNAEIQVIMDAKSDDKIKAKGYAKLKMDYLPDGNFLMSGSYELTEGEYRFSAMNVVAKKFNLQPGSTIVWTGDPLTGRMAITGIYKLKTTINEIVNMSTAPDPNVRVPVECIIKIKGVVEKPEFVFDLNFPDLSTNVTGAAASELNAVVNNFRREPEMMNQQMLFLLISGSFVPITNTNNSGGNNFGSQTVSDLLSKQAAGIIGKAVPNLDVSVDLLNASDPTKGRTVLLSASKRFLDNRLEVQTSYAIDNTQTNFSATYNLKKNGSTKLKVFNKSGFDALYNRNVITSGVGLFYRKDFNEFSELFKKQKTIVH